MSISQHWRAPAYAAAIVLACVAMSACSKKNEPTSVPPLPSSDAGKATPPAAVSSAAPSTDSSLSIKRGTITITSQTRSFRPCNTTVDLTLSDQLDGALERTYADLGAKPIYAEVYGERGTAPASAANSVGGANTFNVEDLLYATVNGVAEACAAPAVNYELLAVGKEPAWSVEVRQDSMVFHQGTAAEMKFSAVDTADTEGTVTYRAGVDKHVLELVVTQRACRAVSGEYFAYTATAKFDKQSFNGCARVGE